jgi:two-component system NarL family response regulator
MVCDDHELFRRGLRMVLESDDGIEVVAEAGDGAEAVALAAEVGPDVILMDVRMPHLSGIEAAKQILAADPDAHVVMLTVSEDPHDLFDAVKVGAAGYLLKEISIEEVAAAVRAVHVGQSLISPSMATKLLAEFRLLADRAATRGATSAPHLTGRELEVLGLVAQGMSNRQIAAELFISENTVKNHVRNILEKLHLHSRTEAVMYAVKEKLIDLDGA